MDALREWAAEHSGWLRWVGFGSAAMFLASLVVLPAVVARIPSDYFTADRAPGRLTRQHPVLTWVGRIAKNVLGVVLILLGVAMLVLPGQGLLAIAVGIMLTKFPGKRELERWVVMRPGVLRAMNWIRAKVGREPLRLDDVPVVSTPSEGKPS